MIRTAFLAAIFAILSLPGCTPGAPPSEDKSLSAGAEFKQSRSQLAQAVQRLASEARPITDRAALASRLKLSPERISVIKTGAQVSEPIAVAFDFGPNCKFGHCTCVGDDECNDMFSTICSSPSTDGSCQETNEGTICTCKYVAADE